jgi:hypothetical protein
VRILGVVVVCGIVAKTLSFGFHAVSALRACFVALESGTTVISVGLPEDAKCEIDSAMFQRGQIRCGDERRL